MSNIILVTGGARSGKSSFAESLCIKQNNKTAYIATSVAFDDEMKNRVKKHQESRPKNWKTYEIYKDIYSIVEELNKNHDTVIMDCVTLMVNNLMFTHGIEVDEATSEELNELENYIREQITKLLEAVKKTNLYFVIVTNEIGMGIVPENKLSRIYGDFVGRANQLIASYSNEVYFVVSGIPMKVK
ncbi:MAG: bifunctional adenosylcobinamide kinase/adenosylcobinamide-phosphate guanylyltransferase [Terrisporobacter othiniensis]|uniref:Adenosylcobinamide kinase n=1 Tax=Terrisporobacter petrolearius TaxID=1460447 RepID=A0ABZ3F852_9FIRM|nr:bifunctional adenosylcobinamide kinase/adenosylcobinamide-phosphate guanylyltransferase [Terrisporobacter petrolearius]MDU4861268.1 bifunctional adenosylcobinamide kinase/adenosylcobinamide-phosphate guanylyltransferase [Terrisporobacter othiniensis]MDU6994902.1 bifunctional adenosylcobinamide kinase/adenosylcobinamide-phosphate guanylyltransferase [Terrisporobacter othiniensis]SFJ54960.1 adenosylcobinamide kinase /adenosylcobinamide-phosphate guanylyltransferase [Terrisporobacter glycolicus]